MTRPSGRFDVSLEKGTPDSFSGIPLPVVIEPETA